MGLATKEEHSLQHLNKVYLLRMISMNNFFHDLIIIYNGEYYIRNKKNYPFILLFITNKTLFPLKIA